MKEQLSLQSVQPSNYLISSGNKLDATWFQTAAHYLGVDRSQIQSISLQIESLVWARLIDLASRRSGRVLLMQIMDDLRSWGLQHKRLEFFRLDEGLDLNLGLRLALKCFSNRFSNVVQTLEHVSSQSAATINSLLSAITPVCIGVLIEEMMPSKHLSEEQWAEDLLAQKEAIRLNVPNTIDLAFCLGGTWDATVAQPALANPTLETNRDITNRSKHVVWLLLLLAAAAIGMILWKYR